MKLETIIAKLKTLPACTEGATPGCYKRVVPVEAVQELIRELEAELRPKDLNSAMHGMKL